MPQEILPQHVQEDDDLLDLLATLKYIRVNYTHFSSPEMCMYETLSALSLQPIAADSIVVKCLQPKKINILLQSSLLLILKSEAFFLLATKSWRTEPARNKNLDHWTLH